MRVAVTSRPFFWTPGFWSILLRKHSGWKAGPLQRKAAGPGVNGKAVLVVVKACVVGGPTPQRVGWTATGPSLAGRLRSLGFCQWVRSRKSHTTRIRGHLRVAISTVPDPSGSGRVDMLTSPLAAARAAVATGAWVKSKHDMYLIRGSVGA